MFAIQPRSLDRGDEELTAVRVSARIGHGQVHGPLVLQLEVLVLKLVSVDALS